jgi:sterol desaturase/sphingolipid hydroxylase (fatty acid hydroxylase superfamily)
VLVGLIEQLSFQALIRLRGFVSFCTNELSAVVIIGSLFWLFTRRYDKKRSLVALLHYLFPKKYYSHPTTVPSYWNIVAFSLIIFNPIASFVGGIRLGEWFAGLLADHIGSSNLHFPYGWANALVQLLIVFWGASFFNYWLHYAFHKVPLLWGIHRVHHSCETPGLTALIHTHPLESLVFGPFMALPRAFLGGLTLNLMGVREFESTAWVIIAAYTTWEIYYSTFEHSHIPLSLGWFDRIYAGPVLHQIHHSIELRHRDKNLGDNFGVIWDWIFGTIYVPEKDEQYRWGLNEEEYGDNNPHLTVRDFYLEPFAYARRVIAGGRRGEQSESEAVA